MKIPNSFYNQIPEILQNHGIILAYIFGSAAKEKTTPLSDFDIAVAFNENFINKEQQFQHELEIAREICSLLTIDRTDVINLLYAQDPLLKHNAVFSGKLLFAKDTKFRFALEKKIMQEYEDTQHLRETSYKIIQNHIKAGTLKEPKNHDRYRKTNHSE